MLGTPLTEVNRRALLERGEFAVDANDLVLVDVLLCFAQYVLL